MEPIRICAAIPAHNEETHIGEVVEEAKKYVDDVIVIDDGSVDDTFSIADKGGARVLRHNINKGYGAAIKSCFDAARRFNADVMVILDGDGQHDPGDIPKLVEPVLEDNTDVVVGSRFLSILNDIPAYRKFGMNVLNRVTWLFSKENLDSQSGFRAYSKKAIYMLNPVDRGMGVSSEILISAREHGLRVGEVPINVRYDVGRSSKNPVDHGVGVILSVVKLVSQKRPLVFFGFSGLASFTVGMFSGWWVLDHINQTHALPIGMTVVTSIFIIVGVLLMGMGMTIYAIQDTIKRSIAELAHHDKFMDFSLNHQGGVDAVDDHLKKKLDAE